MGRRRFWGRNGCMVEARLVFAGEHGGGSDCLPVLCCPGERSQESSGKYSQQRSYFDDCSRDWFLHGWMGICFAGGFDRHEHPQRSVLVLLGPGQLCWAVVDGCAVGIGLHCFSAEFKQYNVQLGIVAAGLSGGCCFKPHVALLSVAAAPGANQSRCSGSTEFDALKRAVALKGFGFSRAEWISKMHTALQAAEEPNGRGEKCQGTTSVVPISAKKSNGL